MWQEHCVHICHHLENRKDGIITMRTRSIHKAALTDAVTPLEEAGKEIAYQAAVEGIVLLENDGCLPLKPGKLHYTEPVPK